MAEYIYEINYANGIRSFGQKEEIIRCKNCKHYNPADRRRPYDCEMGLLACFEDSFCSRGERRGGPERYV